MNYEFRGRDIGSVIRQAIRGEDRERKQIADVFAPPFAWGPWTRIEEVWTPRDSDVSVTVQFGTTTRTQATFEIEIAHGQSREFLGRAIGPGSTTVTLPRNIATALYIRCRAHGVAGQHIDVNVY